MKHMSIDDAHNEINDVERKNPIANEDLAEWLEFAVPLVMAELRILPDVERAARINAWLSDGSRAVGTNGDAMTFPGRKRGRAEVGAAGLAKGVAAEAALNGTATHLGLTFVWPGARPPAPDPADLDDDAPDDGGEWIGNRRVEVVEIPGVSALDSIPECGR